jgi:hypothetical protein
VCEPGGGPGQRIGGGGLVRFVRAERQRRSGQFLAKPAGQGQPEYRPFPPLPPCLQPAPVQPGVLQRDSQAEPGATGGTGPGGVGPPETVEHQVLLTGPEADPAIPDRDRHRVPVRRHGDHHIPSLAMLDRVVEQVPQHPFHPPPVHLGHARLRWQPEVDPGSGAGGQLLGVRGGPPYQIAHVGRFRVQRRHVGIVPADLKQVGQQCLEPLQLALQQLRAAPGDGVELIPGREQHVRGDPDRGQRRAQLMRHVGHELPLHIGQFLQLPQLVLQARGHVVERVRQRGQIIGALGGHALVQVPGRQPAGRLRRLPQRDHHPAGNQ